jgi:hypothetical protein
MLMKRLGSSAKCPGSGASRHAACANGGLAKFVDSRLFFIHFPVWGQLTSPWAHDPAHDLSIHLQRAYSGFQCILTDHRSMDPGQ